MSRHRLLDPKLDLVFKRLFAEAPDLLIDLINAVRMGEPAIVELDVVNPQITPEDVRNKSIMLDILARESSGKLLNLEMQTQRHAGWSTRMLYYLARIFGRQLDKGQDYHHVRPAIGIYLMDFALFPQYEQPVWRFELRDHLHPDVVLDRSLQLHLIEMPKADRLNGVQTPSQMSRALADWIIWFRHWNEETIMQQIQHPTVQQAHAQLHALSASEQAWFQALARERALMQEAALKAEAEEEKAFARAQGLAEGLAEGRAAGQINILRRQLQAKFGDLTASVDRRLQHATADQLEQWAEQVLFAERLDQVFGH